MDDFQENYAHDLKEMLSVRLLSLNNGKQHSHDLSLEVLGIEKKDVEELLRKIPLSLPNFIFMIENEKDQNILQNHIVDDFILFISRENSKADNFGNLFAQFLEFMLDDMIKKYPNIFDKI